MRGPNQFPHAGVLALAVILAACDDSGSPSPGNAVVNVINGAETAQDVEVFIDDELAAETCFPCSSGLIVPSGDRDIIIQVKSTPSLSASVGLDIRAGGRYDIAVFDSEATIAALAVENENGPVGEGAQFHVIHAGSTLEDVDVYVTPVGAALDGLAPARSGLAFGDVWYAPVDPLAEHIRVTPVGSKTVLGESFMDQGRTIVLFGSPAFVFAIP
jgi:hypothetical protein